MQKILTAAGATLVLAAGLSTPALAAGQNGDILIYRVWEEGLQPYQSRILVTPGFVRFDEGEGAVDYTLFDRRQGIIYNVSYEDRGALVIDPPPMTLKQPDSLKLEQQNASDPAAPRIAGLATRNVTLTANGEVCRELVTVPGLLPESMAGLREFQQVLARVQAATLAAIPEDMQTPCDLADNVYAPLRPLDHGLPIQERSPSRSRSLEDFSAGQPLEEGLFVIPEGYARTPMPGLMSRD